MLFIRPVGALLLGIGAVVVFFAMAPEKPDTDYTAQVEAVLMDDSINNMSTQGAPQQAVVNGWTARDLLAIQTRALDNSAASDDRPAALLLIGVLAIVLGLATSGPSDATGSGLGSPSGGTSWNGESAAEGTNLPLTAAEVSPSWPPSTPGQHEGMQTPNPIDEGGTSSPRL